MKIVFFFAFLAFFASAVAAQPASAEKGRIRLDSIERLFGKARETVNVNVDGGLIKFAVALLDDDDPEEKAIKEMAVDRKGVYVRRLEFKAGGQYAESDLADIRAQLNAPGWSKIVDVKGAGADDWEIEDAEIYVTTQDGRIEGLVVIVAEPRSITVANVVSAMDLEKLKRLGGKLGVPKITINRRKITITTEEPKKKP